MSTGQLHYWQLLYQQPDDNQSLLTSLGNIQTGYPYIGTIEGGSFSYRVSRRNV